MGSTAKPYRFWLNFGAVVMRKFFFLLALPLLLVACGTAEPIWAPDEQVAAARYVAPGPKSLTLYTVINNRSGSGAHSALMVNGSQRVIFDPAGTFKSPQIPERNDVHFGATPRVVELYEDYHARESFHVIAQTVEVSPAVAERALRLVQEYGAVPKANCSNAITTILKQVPGFETLKHTWYPKQASDSFATFPGVSSRKIFDNDSDDNRDVLVEAQNL